MARRTKLTPTQKKNIEKTSWTGDEMVKADLPEPEYVIPKYLPEGMTVLGGRPFAGKSFMSLQMGISIATGGMFFDQKVRQGRCLYIAAEDTVWGFKKRLTGQGFNKSDGRLEIELAWKRFSQGGMDELTKRLNEKEYDLCILDSFYKFLSGKKKEKDGEIEPIATQLHNFCKKGILGGVLLLAHTNKASVYNEDSGESAISGDSALTGVADSFITISSFHNKKELSGGGRNMSAFSQEIKFDEVTLTWQLYDSKTALKKGSVRAEIKKVVQDKKEPLSAGMVSAFMGKDPSYIRREMNTLTEQGHLFEIGSVGRSKEVFFDIADEDDSTPMTPVMSIFQ